ncbi:type IV pilus assembly protein PilE [Chromobacterium alkanivorans]|uniref:type IV pilin protein n=1 Tax=Chromobacterium alkanivorans TaxID=1071719 RepID=UPI00216AA4D7|nr:type IV pilin protein [Chromobacterium alkanivorans]MCS3802899.1 type IV pilus assembly protein PilE [Chromobacterium alkanivorans]MCS3817225.1 type IV pilus assembly protein PilE [Chromobacterium alkanivorans]MCS3872265.1 type IV pilus assembly protein PilE [Chromobacterium alkanivorans]
MRTPAGLSLLELLTAMAVTAILAAMAWPAYQQQILRGQLAEARAALLENLHFVQRWHLENRTRSATWPPLPRPGTRDFEIRLGSVSLGSDSAGQASFRLLAKPRAGHRLAGRLQLSLDQDGNLSQCGPDESGPQSCVAWGD